MRSVLFVLSVFLMLNAAYATQTLNKGYFLYNNVTVAEGGSIMVGVNTSSNINLIVVHSYDFGSYVNGKTLHPLYNSSVGTGIYQISAAQGKYTVISQAQRATNLNVGVISVPAAGGKLINLDGKYSFSFYLSNYSKIQIPLLSSADYINNQLVVNISRVSSNINPNANLDTVNLTLNRGWNEINITSSAPMKLYYVINATPELVDPLQQIYSKNNYSVGVVSYGLYNISSKLYPYQVRTNEIVGLVNISALTAYNPTPQPNSSVYGASLQLNVGLNKTLRAYWLQDVVDFNTSGDQYYLLDNIWNNTSPSANVTQGALSGGGNVSLCASCSSHVFYVDSYPAYFINYTLPMSLKLVIFENQTPGGVMVSFGYQVLSNGTKKLIGPLIFFDHVLVAGSSNGTLLTTPFYQTPGGGGGAGNYYDSELVFAGESSGENSNFNNINSTMWIYYNKSGVIVPFPSVYTFGLSTAETATNARVVGDASGGARIVTGMPQFSADLFAPNALTNVATYISNTSSYASLPTTVPASLPGVPQEGAIALIQSDKLEIAAVVVIILVLIVGFLLLRRH